MKWRTIHYFCYPRPQPKNKFFGTPRNTFVFDQYPVLVDLIPFGTNLKKVYKEALVRAFTGDRREEIVEVMWAIANMALKDSWGRHVHIVNHKPRGQNVLMAFKEFLEEYMPVFYDHFVNPKVNAAGADWSAVTEEKEPTS